MKNSSPTQNIVTIKEIRDRVAVLDDGSVRAVLLTTSINFALKSEDERNATLFQFQSFLNTLDFPLQIHIQSREMDINPYLNLLEEQYDHQENELLKIQIKEYIEFVKNFTESVNIMTKSFFVIIPYYSFFQSGQTGFLSSVFGSNQERETKRKEAFEQQLVQLEQRVGVVDQGLTRCGLRTHRLEDQELIELYHSIFNPEEGGAIKVE